MRSYLLDITERFKRFDEKLDVKSLLCNKSWQVFNDSGAKEVYIFQENGTLIVSIDGKVSSITWQYIPANRSVIINSKEESFMLIPSFVNQNIFVLQLDGTREYIFLMNEANRLEFPIQSLTNLKDYLQEVALEKEKKEKQQLAPPVIPEIIEEKKCPETDKKKFTLNKKVVFKVFLFACFCLLGTLGCRSYQFHKLSLCSTLEDYEALYKNDILGFTEKKVKEQINLLREKELADLGIFIKYSEVDSFSEGLAVVRKKARDYDKKTDGVINTKGEMVVPYLYDKIYPFKEGMARICDKNKYGFINKEGEEIVRCRYSKAEDFSEGYAVVSSSNGNGIYNFDSDYWYINTDGEEVLRLPENAKAYSFSEGLAAIEFSIVVKNVKDKPKKDITDFLDSRRRSIFGYINKDGELVIPAIYEEVRPFKDGLAIVKENGKQGIIDRKGNKIIPCVYDKMGEFENGLAYIKENNKYGFINKKGRKVIDCIYDEIALNGFSEGLCAVKKDNRWGFVDETGSTVITFDYTEARSFKEGLVAVKKYGKWGYIDQNEKVIVDFLYQGAYNFEGEMAMVKTNIVQEYNDYGLLVEKRSDVGYINKEGKEIVPCRVQVGYGKFLQLSDDLLWISFSKIIDKDGNEIYNRISPNKPYSYYTPDAHYYVFREQHTFKKDKDILSFFCVNSKTGETIASSNWSFQ